MFIISTWVVLCFIGPNQLMIFCSSPRRDDVVVPSRDTRGLTTAMPCALRDSRMTNIVVISGSEGTSCNKIVHVFIRHPDAPPVAPNIHDHRCHTPPSRTPRCSTRTNLGYPEAETGSRR